MIAFDAPEFSLVSPAFSHTIGRMISRSIALLLVFITSSVFGQNPKQIFDGKTFSGWEQRGEAIWEISDGVITGRTGKGGHGWLCRVVGR